jgi:hypothetical protein
MDQECRRSITPASIAPTSPFMTHRRCIDEHFRGTHNFFNRCGQLLDEGPYTAFQKVVVLLAALSIVMDGFDGQLIGFAIPLIIKEWNVTRAAFAPVVAAGLVGMGIGSACAGLFADRFGRRWAVIGSVLLFGSATCAIGLAPNLMTIAVLRFLAGLGIGGALPSSTTMTAEFTPLRRRTSRHCPGMEWPLFQSMRWTDPNLRHASTHASVIISMRRISLLPTDHGR